MTLEHIANCVQRIHADRESQGGSLNRNTVRLQNTSGTHYTTAVSKLVIVLAIAIFIEHREITTIYNSTII